LVMLPAIDTNATSPFLPQRAPRSSSGWSCSPAGW
jgi:hypothetical protein